MVKGRERAAAMTIVIVVAALLRLWSLESVPVALNQDEAVNGYDAFAIGRTFRDHHGNVPWPMLQSFNDWSSPLLTFITVPFVAALGLSEWSIRLPAALLGVGAIPLMFSLVRSLGGSYWAAWSAAWILALSPWHIGLSRWAVAPTATPFFLVLTYWCAVRFVRSVRHDLAWAFALGISGAALTYSYSAQKLFAPLLVGWSCAIYLLERYRQDRTRLVAPLASAAACVLTFSVLFLPILVAHLRENDRYNWHFKNMSLFAQSPSPWLDAAGRYLEYFSPAFYFGGGDPDPLQHLQGLSAVPVACALLMVLGVVACIRALGGDASETTCMPRPAPAAGMWMLGLLAMGPLPASLTLEHMHTNRALQLLVFTPVLAASGIDVLRSALVRERMRALVVASVAVLVLADGTAFAYRYFGSYREESKQDWQYGIKEALALVRRSARPCPTVTIDARVNQPYIFYLFYSRYPPELINHAALHGPPASQLGWLHVRAIGNYAFTEIDRTQLANSRLVGEVRDESRTWYSVFQDRETGQCFVRRGY